MGVANVPLGSSTRLTCAIAVGCLLSTCEAVAFPATDAGTPSVVENAPPPTESDLRHQLQLQSGIGAAAAGSNLWTFVPSLGADEFFTDNVLQAPTDRRWDLVTVVTPGIAINGNAPNAQVTLNYNPQFRLDARTPSQNGVTQQLAGTGLFTIVQDEFYVDTRVFAGGTPLNSGFGGLGTNVAPNLGLGGVNGSATTGLSRQNTAQTFTGAITPYWLHRFGDFGTAKVGYELSGSSISQQSGGGFPTFFPTGGANQQNVTNQGVAQFETGEEFAPYRYMVVASGSASNGTGVLHGSNEESIKNRLGYEITRAIGVYGQVGYERERFGGVPPIMVNDAIWGIGATWAPNADSQITLGYGHENGTTGVQLSAYYALSARTRITASYQTGLQTDLGQLQSQLDLTAFNQNGAAVDALTGAPLFSGLNGIGIQNGLFRGKTFSMSATTSLDRDYISFVLEYSEQTTLAVDNNLVATNPFSPVAPPVGSTSQGVTGIALWQHSLSEDLMLSSSASYGVTSVSGGNSGAPGTGRQTSIGASVGLQYALTPTLTTQARYAYFRRGSPLPDETIYQNVFLVGVNKQF
jgi:uncharacterized protein (PEP-CTERM system associated)